MTTRPELKLMPLAHHAGLPLPAYQTASAAGLDLAAAIDDDIILNPGARHSIATGLAMAIPTGFEGQLRPRSGLAAKHGVTVANSPGTIDADYRGEVLVILINLGNAPMTISRGMRIAQLIIAPVCQADIALVDDLDNTERGKDGFGSTGVASRDAKDAGS
ncbi:MAG: dUTP diphosphatase [Alphaproteobacteria bacterium]|nr:dUTP diphosphatase [Alphaproteobacteria bacterium]